MDLMRAAIDDSVGEELPAEPGRSKAVDVDSLTTRITTDVILRTLFSHATTKAEASKVSTAIRALTRQSMREVFWAFIPPRMLPYPRRAVKLEHLRNINTQISTHTKTRTDKDRKAHEQGKNCSET